MENKEKQNELKPCPFCGGEIEFNLPMAMYNAEYEITCLDCGMRFVYEEKHENLKVRYDGLGMTEVYDRMIRKNLPFIEAWNRRVNQNENIQ